MNAGGDTWRPQAAPGRLTALVFIASAHAAVVAAIALLGGTAAIVREARPLFVHFVAPAPLPPPAPAHRVPLPAMRAPQIELPAPPVIETIAVRVAERAAPVTEMAAKAAATEAPRAAPAAAPAESPRFDLAYLNNPAPAYPPLSRRLREEGRVVLRVLVNAAGLVDRIEVAASSGHARLDETALDAVRRWKFLPARSGGEAVAGWAMVPIAFNLRG